MPAVAKKSAFTIYKLTDNTSIYIGITTQALSTRLRQHKQDAKLDGSCAITAKLCQKKAPKDLKALHRRLRDHPERFTISALKTMEATYAQAHREELTLKAKYSNLL